MSNILWQRLGAASGIVFVLVLVAPDLIQGGPSEDFTMTAAEQMAQSCATLTAARLTDAIYPITHVLGYLIFLFFLGSLWSALRRAEGGDGWLSAAGFGGGLVSLAVKFASGAASVAANSNACAGIDPQLWQVLQDMNNASFFYSFLPLAILLVASAVVAIRFGAPLPRWLGWMSAVVAVALLVDGFAGMLYARDFGPSLLLFVVWILAASIALVRRAGQPLPTVASAHRD